MRDGLLTTSASPPAPATATAAAPGRCGRARGGCGTSTLLVRFFVVGLFAGLLGVRLWVRFEPLAARWLSFVHRRGWDIRRHVLRMGGTFRLFRIKICRL